MIPVPRILQKLDKYFAKNDLAGACHHLETWLDEAQALRDDRGKIIVLNELLGVYRKSENREKAFAAVETVLQLMEEGGLTDTLSGGTYSINCATVYTAFGHHEKALVLFRKAREIYEATPGVPLEQLGSLYNNMAMAYLPLGRHKEARELSQKALETMEQSPDTLAEQAITWLNIANITEAEQGIESGWGNIEPCLTRANTLLEAPENEYDGNYAFACSKCAPVFDYYGYFFYAAKLKERARDIYERT